MKLEGSVVLITGAGRRIGAAMAQAVAHRGGRVVIHYHRSKKEAEKLVHQIEKEKGVVCLVEGDLSIAQECERVVQEAHAAFGRLDVLINNAAVFFKTPFLEVTEHDWDRTLNANLKGSFFCAQAAARVMKRGKIINIADWSGMRPYIHYLPYCISKAGVIAMTKGLARTLAPNIEVNAIAPGPMLLPEDFDEAEREAIIRHTPLEKIGTPQDVVNAALFLIEGTSFMTGATIVIDGGRLIS